MSFWGLYACYFSAYYSITAVVSACAFAGFEKKYALSVYSLYIFYTYSTEMGRRYLPRGQGTFCLDDAKRLDRQP